MSGAPIKKEKDIFSILSKLAGLQNDRSTLLNGYLLSFVNTEMSASWWSRFEPMSPVLRGLWRQITGFLTKY